MSRRAKLIIGIIVLAILALLAWLIVAGRRPMQPALPATSTPPASTPQPLQPIQPIRPLQPTRVGAPALDAFARSFAERYGSFSNQSGFANLKELLPFMTEELRKESEELVARAAAANAPYAGTTTKALAIKERNVGESAATFIISTQRRESTAQNSAAKIYYQDLELTLTKVSQDWKVSRAVWK